jgi:hypothetical protein
MAPRQRQRPPPLDDLDLGFKLTGLLLAPKVLTQPLAWATQGDALRASVTLEINGATAQGLTLFARAFAAFPDRRVSLGLAWHDIEDRGGAFTRLDWRPVEGHNNKGLGPAHLRFQNQEFSQHHPLALNAAIPIGLGRAIGHNLPIAEPLEPDPPDWTKLCEAAENLWKLQGLVGCDAPPWQYDLLTKAGPTRRRKGKR